MVVLLVKKAFHPCVWIALASLIMILGVFMIRNIKAKPIESESAATFLSTTESIRKININTADSSTLEQLPGIGPTTAGKIIAYRDANGPFSDPAQLLNIPGIGEKKLIALLEYVYWEE